MLFGFSEWAGHLQPRYFVGPLLAPNGPVDRERSCPLIGVKQTQMRTCRYF